MPVLEAMAAGIPVIAGNRSSLPEVAGDAAVLVDPSNQTELENALEKVAQDPSLRNRLIAGGVARARLFTWEKAVGETAAIYRELR